MKTTANVKNGCGQHAAAYPYIGSQQIEKYDFSWRLVLAAGARVVDHYITS